MFHLQQLYDSVIYIVVLIEYVKVCIEWGNPKMKNLSFYILWENPTQNRKIRYEQYSDA